MHVKLSDGEYLKVYETETGRYLPSVTQVLDVVERRWRSAWIERVGKEEAERRGEEGRVLGSRVHKVAEDVANYGCKPHACGCGGLENLEADMVPYHQSVARFLDTYVDEVLGIELQLVCQELGVGGTLDLHVRLRDGSLAIIDYKTSKSIDRMYGLQLAAYNLMLLLDGKQATRRFVVHLRKDDPGRYEVKEFVDHEREAKAFLSLLDFWNWRYGADLDEIQKRVVRAWGAA